MLIKNIIEEVQQIFPQIGETQLIKKVDVAQKNYADETRILTKLGQLSDISTNITWVLPSDCLVVRDVLFYDSNGIKTSLDDLDISYEIIFGKITFVKEDGTQLTGIPTSASYGYLDYIYQPATIDDIDDTLEIPETLHEGIKAKLMKDCFAAYPVDLGTNDGVIKTRDWRAVGYWRGEYDNYVKKGKRQATTDYDNTDYANIKKDVFGYPVEVPRQRITTTTTVNVSSLSSVYSKYLRFTATSPSTIAIAEQFGWDTSIDTPTITSNVITVLSSAEFTATMTAITNIGINYERTDTSTWTFDVYDSWGTLQVEIYER